jgi:hypothetical protein
MNRSSEQRGEALYFACSTTSLREEQEYSHREESTSTILHPRITLNIHCPKAIEGFRADLKLSAVFTNERPFSYASGC